MWKFAGPALFLHERVVCGVDASRREGELYCIQNCCQSPLRGPRRSICKVIFFQDVILVRPTCSFPKGLGTERLLDNGKSISDSASSVHANGSARLQDSLEEQAVPRSSFTNTKQ